jgi:PadR family transcriptional regulator, regulatory protein AphA
MSLSHAILGTLRAEPMTGYDLKTRCFDQSVAHFWPADQAQIYRTLDRMAADGWVESAIETQDGRPNRKEYRITGAGRDELARWLLTDLALPALRDPFLIQLFFADPLSNAQIDGLLLRQIAHHRERLQRLEAIPLPALSELTASREFSLQRLTLELGLALERAHIAWAEQARQVVTNLPEPPTQSAG